MVPPWAHPQRRPPPRAKALVGGCFGVVATAILLSAQPARAGQPNVSNATTPYWAHGINVKESDITCLRYQKYGCSEIKDRAICEVSRDGRKGAFPDLDVYGSPCVWCNEAHCTGTSDAICEPLAYLTQGAPKYFPSFLTPGSFNVANCHQAVKLPDLDFHCLLWSEDGCSWIGEKNLCLRSRDGRREGTYTGTRTSGTPCVWCGGGVCTEKSAAQCQSFEYLYNGQGVIFNNFHQPLASTFSTCDGFGSPRVVRLGPSPKYEVLFDVEDIQCGGQNYEGSTQCPRNMYCTSRGLNSFCERIPPQPGRFITSGEQVWWQDQIANKKHLVPPGVNCSNCGCKGNMTAVAPYVINEIPTGGDFNCGMVFPAINPVPLELESGRFVTDGRQVWWHNSVEGKKHLVPPGIDCARCGCAGNMVLVTPGAIDALPTGDIFGCSMVASHVSLLGASAPSAGSTPVAAGKAEQVKDKGYQWQVIAMLLVGACVSFVSCYYMAGVSEDLQIRRKKRSADVEAHPAQDDSSSPQATAPLMWKRVFEESPPSPLRTFRLVAPVGVEVAPPVTTAVVQDPTHYVEVGSNSVVSRQGNSAPPPRARSPVLAGRGLAQSSVSIGSRRYASVALSSQSTTVPTPRIISMASSDPQSMFNVIDQNHDGAITRDEWQRFENVSLSNKRSLAPSPPSPALEPRGE